MGKGKRLHAMASARPGDAAAHDAIMRFVGAVAQQSVRRAMAELARQLYARAGQLEGEIGPDNPAVLALYAASAAATQTRLEGLRGAAAPREGLEASPAPVRGSAGVAAAAAARPGAGAEGQ